VSWDDDDGAAAEQRRRRQEMLTTVDKALATLVVSGLSISNAFGWTHVSADAAVQINTGLAILSPLLVWLIPNKKV
jgi:hypothetical protein